MNYTDRIFPTNKGLTTYLEELKEKNYQIPTFQRDVVWEEENVKKLWDSIYKFYPIGSILIWKTDLKLQNHRHIGGHEIAESDPTRTNYQYILDGQQRTTSLLTSLHGGRIEGKEGFDPTLYVDLTVPIDGDIDDTSFKRRFLFWDEIDDKNGERRAKIEKIALFEEGLIVKLIDIKTSFGDVERRIVEHKNSEYKDYDHSVRKELRRISDVLNNYRISFIELKGIQVAEVCQIFERINQSGKPLSIFDIVVAKTFKHSTQHDEGFYLRDLIKNLREFNKSPYLQISDVDYLQILAVIIHLNIEQSGVKNITDRFLNEIKTEHILEVWDTAKDAILKTFDFFENYLHVRSPNLIPFRYLYMTIASYLYGNQKPNYEFLKKYFWFYSFHNDDLLSNTTHLFTHIKFMEAEKFRKPIDLTAFRIDKMRLRESSYSSKGRLSRAILAYYSSKQPKDWEYCNRDVLIDNYFSSTDKPNLHHVFPTNSEYVLNHKHQNMIDSNSLMNIVYLPQITNLKISNKNPLDYLREYDRPDFRSILDTHLLPEQLLEWAEEDRMPDNALDQFIEYRVDNLIDDLRKTLSGVKFEVIDTAQSQS